MLWLDSHRPKSFDDPSNVFKSSFQTTLLKSISKQNNMPHILIHGPNGSGKTTLVYCLLFQIFGNGIMKMKNEVNEFKTPSSNKIIELNVLSSCYHIDISPSDVKRNDRIVIQDLIKSMAQSVSLINHGETRFKVIVIRYANRLSVDAQHALRRTMEKYISTCRVILICDHLSGIMDPVRSRCLCVRNSAPSSIQIKDLLLNIAKRENTRFCDDGTITNIVKFCDFNMRRAILMMQAIEFQRFQGDNDEIYLTDWEVLLESISKMVLASQKPKQLLEIRAKLYLVLARCITPDTILKKLVNQLSKSVDLSLKPMIYHLACNYSHRMNNGDKPIIHLESFIAASMLIINDFITDISEIDMNNF